MAFYLIAYGMGGGFGGAVADFISEYSNKSEAENDAYQLAREDYESYEGFHGIRSYADISDEDFEGEESDEVEAVYEEELNSWVDYSAKEVFLDENKVWRYVSSNEEVDIDGEGISII